MSEGHSHSAKPEGEKRLLAALALNISLTAVQVVGGILSGSLALLADAAHNGSDAASLGISYGARRISKKQADRRRTFGYNRAEVIGALINLTTLFLIAFFLGYQAVNRLINPPEIQGTTMLIVGGIAFVEDALSAYLLYQGSKGSLNIRSAFIHMLGDTMATIGVIAGALLIMFYGIYVVDPILTGLISVYIFVHSYVEIKKAIYILMESTPRGFDFDRMIQSINALEGIKDIHHVHTWLLDEQHVAMEAHIVVAQKDLIEIETLKSRIKQTLQKEFGIEHATLEFEVEGLEGHDQSTVPPHA